MQAVSEVGASWDEGYPVGAVEDFIQELVDAGQAVEQGAFVVLDPSVCTIRLPQIETDWALDDPQILALTSAIDAYPDEPGCFLQDLPEFFSETYPDPVRALEAYTSFVAAHILSGDARFYSASPLATPVGFQVMTGACGEVPEAEAIADSHTYISDAAFAQYVAYLSEHDACFSDHTGSGVEAARSVQRLDPETGAAPDGAPLNAWLFMEYTMITLAMGWRNGGSMTELGLTRPPLCRWP